MNQLINDMLLCFEGVY